VICPSRRVEDFLKGLLVYNAGFVVFDVHVMAYPVDEIVDLVVERVGGLMP
jgi:hypothetical protein